MFIRNVYVCAILVLERFKYILSINNCLLHPVILPLLFRCLGEYSVHCLHCSISRLVSVITTITNLGRIPST